MAETDSKAQQPSGLSRWTSSLPTNLMSMLNPFSDEDGDKAKTEDDKSTQQSTKRLSIFSSFLSSPAPAGPPSPDKDKESMMFAEPETQSNSDDASREGSVNVLERRRSKKSNRPKTRFSICHPPPTSTARQRLHRRPRPLMQLHRLSANARPQPAFEVIPSANFSVRLTKAITKVFKTKHGLCPNDLVVLRAEKYSANEPDEEQEASDIIALICKGRKEDGGTTGKAKICLPEGREWEAYPTPTGGYEFFSTDEHGLGLTVRWVQKKNKDVSKSVDSDTRRFNFSTISPNSRQHPVIASLSNTELHINETYKMPNPSAVTPLSTPKLGATVLSDTMEEESGNKEQCETDDRLRQIIVMTGIWVAFKEGWSPTFKYDDKERDFSGVARSPSLQYSPAKASTFGSAVSTPPSSPSLVPVEKRNSFKAGILRTGSLLGRGNRMSTTSVPEETTEYESATATGRKRADSASTVLVHRAASNRAKNRQATWRPDLLSAQHDMQESSTEDVSHTSPEPSPSESTTSEAWPATIPPRRASVARPILPPTYSSGQQEAHESEPSTSGVKRRVSRSQPASAEKRESSTTTATRSSTQSPRKPPTQAQGSIKKRKGGWRRLLCGGGHDI